MDFHNARGRCCGLTLVELLTTLAAGLILLTTAVPTYRSVVSRQQITSELNGFMAHLQLARSEAIKQARRVSICPSIDSTSCVADYKRWHEGYIVFADLDADRRRSPADPLLRIHQGSGSPIRIQTSSNYRKILSYRPDGTAWGSNTTIRVCDPDNSSLNRAIALLGTGRPRLLKKMPDGSAIRCD